MLHQRWHESVIGDLCSSNMTQRAWCVPEKRAPVEIESVCGAVSGGVVLAIGEYRGTLDRRSPREATDACVSLRPLSKLSGETRHPSAPAFFIFSP